MMRDEPDDRSLVAELERDLRKIRYRMMQIDKRVTELETKEHERGKNVGSSVS